MEKKQGFFSALKQEVVRGLSPGRTRRKSISGGSVSGSVTRKRVTQVAMQEFLAEKSGGLRPVEALAPLREGPDTEEGMDGRDWKWGQWMRAPLSRAPSDLRMLMGVLGAPLAPVHVSWNEPFPHLSIKDTPIESSSAQYILQQYIAASGGQRFHNCIHNAYATGKVRMLAFDSETAGKAVKSRNSSRTTESGGFVLWQMNPDMWYVEVALGGSKIHAGCNGKLVWRHTPWLGSHAAKGPVRPLRRALQGLDPRTTANMFTNARCIGEKKIDGEDCFILKLRADPQTLKARSEGPAEIIRHVLFGYFSQKTGLLLHLEDSHLTRVQTIGGDAVYWETTINSFLDDYRSVEGIMIAHSGRSVVTLFRFGETAMSHTKTRMEEAWTIEEVAFNVPGLSLECFIPPAEIGHSSSSETCEIPQNTRAKNTVAAAAHRTKFATSNRFYIDDRYTKN
ncbi:hypothetical protein ACET3Z_008966 [Daucus carota]